MPNSTTRTYINIGVEPGTKPPTNKSHSKAKPPTSKSRSAAKHTSKSHPAKKDATAKDPPGTNSSTSDSRPRYQYRSVPQYQSGPNYMDPTMGQYYPGPSRPMRECSPVRKPPPAARVPKIEILQIPYDNPEMYLLRVPLHVIDAKSTKYTPLEHTLGHVPNLWGKDAKPFEWRDRSLTIIPATEIDPNCEYDYFMYKSKNKQVGPKANGYFDQFDGAGIDGDVFVFRMESDSFDGPTGRAEYVDMENDFVQSLYDMYEGAIGIVTRLAELKKPGTSQGKS